MSRGVGVTEALRTALPEWSVEVFSLLALLGDLVVIVPVLAVLYLASVLSSLGRPDGADDDEPLCSDQTAVTIAVVMGGLALVVLLKGTFSMPRPPAELHAVSASEHGFPSGHTMAATVLWGALAWWATVGDPRTRLAAADPRTRFAAASPRTRLAAASPRTRFAAASPRTRVAVVGAIVSVVGFSRLALGVHYLVDVVASVLFGGVYLAVALWLLADRPLGAFGLAIGLAVLATAATGGSDRALLALVGTVGAVLGWQFVERPPIRRLLVRGYGRAFDSSSRS